MSRPGPRSTQRHPSAGHQLAGSGGRSTRPARPQPNGRRRWLRRRRRSMMQWAWPPRGPV